MNESESQPTRLNALLVQDEAISSFSFEEFRMKLEASIRRLERRARAVRRATWLVLGVFLFCVVLGPLMQVLGFAEHQGVRPGSKVYVERHWRDYDVHNWRTRCQLPISICACIDARKKRPDVNDECQTSAAGCRP